MNGQYRRWTTTRDGNDPAGGMERDLQEFDALFAASGWDRTGTHSVGGGYSLLTVETA